MVYPDSVQEIRLRRLDEAPVAWSVGEDALADYEEGDDLYQYLYRVNARSLLRDARTRFQSFCKALTSLLSERRRAY